MDSIADLGLRIDSSQVTGGIRALRDLVPASLAAQQATEALARVSATASAKVRDEVAAVLENARAKRQAAQNDLDALQAKQALTRSTIEETRASLGITTAISRESEVGKSLIAMDKELAAQKRLVERAQREETRSLEQYISVSERAAGAARNYAAAYQAQINALVSTGRADGSGMRSVYAAGGSSAQGVDPREADLGSTFSQLDAIRAKYNDVFAASKRYEAALDEINRANKIGAISAHEMQVAIDRENAAFATGYKHLGQFADRSNATRYEMINLGRQIGDIGTMVALGASPFSILASQAAQVVDVFATAEGGAKAFVGRLAALATTANLVKAGLAGLAIGGTLYFWDDIAGAYNRAFNPTPYEKYFDAVRKLQQLQNQGTTSLFAQAKVGGIAVDERDVERARAEVQRLGAILRDEMMRAAYTAREGFIRELAISANDISGALSGLGQVRSLIAQQTTLRQAYSLGFEGMSEADGDNALRSMMAIGNALESQKDATGALITTQGRFLSQEQITIKQGELRLRSITATSRAQRVAIAEEEARLGIIGQAMTQEDRLAQIRQAGAIAGAQFDEEARRAAAQRAEAEAREAAAIVERNKKQAAAAAERLLEEGRLRLARAREKAMETRNEVLGDIRDPLADFRKRSGALNGLFGSGQIGAAAYGEYGAKAEQDLLRSFMPTDFSSGFINELRLMQLETRSAFADMGTQAASIFGPDGTLISGLGDAAGRALFFGDSAGEAMKNLARTIGADLVSALVKLGLNMAMNAALGDTVAAASMAQTVAFATAAGSAWAAPAALASLASFGTNAAPAMAGVAATMASVQAMSLLKGIPGFADGIVGIPGPGSSRSDNILARVSPGESIMNAPATRRHAPMLAAMNAGRDVGGQMRVEVVHDGSTSIQVERVSDSHIRLLARQEVYEHTPRAAAASQRDPNGLMAKATQETLRGGRRRL